MKFVTIKIDFSNIETLDDLHDVLFKTFGFPDFYGRNIHALIDCISSIRYPEEGMTSFFLASDEFLLIRTKKMGEVEDSIAKFFIYAIECLNRREQMSIRQDLVFLLPE